MVNRLGAYLELILAMAIVGSSVVVGKLVIVSFPVFLAAGLRFAIGSLVLFPLLLKQEGLHLSIGKRNWAILFLQAFTGAFLFTIFLFYGLKLTNAAEAGLITSTTPAVVGVLSFLFLKEKLTATKGIGIGLAVCGVFLSTAISPDSGSAQGSLLWLGYLLVFGAVVGEALFTIFRKMLTETISPLFTASMMSGFSLILFLPLAMVEAVNFDFSQVTLTEWMPVLYYGVVVTGIAFILWFQGVSKVPASTAAVFTGVMPVSAVLFSYVILHQPFSWSHIWGGACVLIGLAFIVGESFAKPVNQLSNQGVNQNVCHIRYVEDNLS